MHERSRGRRGDAAADSLKPFMAPPGPLTSLSLAVLLDLRPLRPRTLEPFADQGVALMKRIRVLSCRHRDGIFRDDFGTWGGRAAQAPACRSTEKRPTPRRQPGQSFDLEQFSVSAWAKFRQPIGRSARQSRHAREPVYVVSLPEPDSHAGRVRAGALHPRQRRRPRAGHLGPSTWACTTARSIELFVDGLPAASQKAPGGCRSPAPR